VLVVAIAALLPNLRQLVAKVIVIAAVEKVFFL